MSPTYRRVNSPARSNRSSNGGTNFWLSIELDRSASVPLVTQLERRLSSLIDAGALPAGYDSASGLARLREQLAIYLARTRGARIGPEQIVLCTGLPQALGWCAWC